MATSRRSATNENISTYGVARDYSTLNTWEAATDLDLVSNTQSQVLECYDDAANFDDNLNDLAGATTNSSYFRIVRPASGEGHDGTPNNGVYFLHTGSAICMDIAEDYGQLQDLLVGISSTANGQMVVRFQSGSTPNYGIGLILVIADGGSSNCRGLSARDDNHIYINCLMQDADRDGIRFESAVGQTAYAYNCTAVNCGERGFNQTSGDAVIKNCLGDNNATNDFNGTFAAGTVNNASGDASAPGTSSRINQTFTFVNAAGDDFHLAYGDAGARNFGTDLSADGVFAFDDDINDGTMGGSKAGITRPQETVWDIGFSERTPSSSSSSSSS